MCFVLTGCGNADTNSNEDMKGWSDDLLQYPYDEGAKEVNGITFTDNGDGTISLSGTAIDAASYYFILPNTDAAFTSGYDRGAYFLSGGVSKECMLILCYRQNGENIKNNQADTGRGAVFMIDPASEDYNQFSVEMYVKAGTNVDDITISPSLQMIELP